MRLLPCIEQKAVLCLCLSQKNPCRGKSGRGAVVTQQVMSAGSFFFCAFAAPALIAACAAHFYMSGSNQGTIFYAIICQGRTMQPSRSYSSEPP